MKIIKAKTAAARVLFFGAGAVFLLAAGCAAPRTQRADISPELVAVEREKQEDFAAAEFVRISNRLHRVSFPLLAAAAPFCQGARRSAGALILSEQDFPEELRKAAARKYELKNGHAVFGVAPNSPAQKAGLKSGDVVTAANGAPFKGGEIVEKDGEQFSLLVVRSGGEIKISGRAEKLCDNAVQFELDDGLNAYADGENVVVFKGLLRFADDYELAVVIAHEIAHNAMKHINALMQNTAPGALADILIIAATGVDVGVRDITAQTYSQAFEQEADYVGLYIMARAGMTLNAAPNIWRRFAAEHLAQGAAPDIHASHPSTAERYIALEKTIAEINSKIERGESLTPNFQ